MQALQPMHLPAVTCTVLPKASTWLAPVGQQFTQGGLSQWLQRSEGLYFLLYSDQLLDSLQTNNLVDDGQQHAQVRDGRC